MDSSCGLLRPRSPASHGLCRRGVRIELSEIRAVRLHWRVLLGGCLHYTGLCAGRRMGPGAGDDARDDADDPGRFCSDCGRLVLRCQLRETGPDAADATVMEDAENGPE